jgi:OOP family OmpA-OmpF porin
MGSGHWIGILTLLTTSCALNVHAQNLVPNPSFEELIDCPDWQSQLDHTQFWFSPTLEGSPDYYNACGTSAFGVPDNMNGHQVAHAGSAYAGAYLYIGNPPHAREYIEVELTGYLEHGSCYRFEMFVSLTDSSIFTTDDIGAHFSTTPIADVPGFPPLSVLPQVVNTTGTFLTDTAWVMVSGEFNAAGGERYLLIGNFLDDQQTTLAPASGVSWPAHAYCYVDDVSLVPCGTMSIGDADDRISADLVGPNPFTDQLVFDASLPVGTQLRIVEMNGRAVFEGSVSNNRPLDTTTWSAGLYAVGLFLPDGSRMWSVLEK